MFKGTPGSGWYETLDASKSEGMAVVTLSAYWRRVPCENESRRIPFFRAGSCIRDVVVRDCWRNTSQGCCYGEQQTHCTTRHGARTWSIWRADFLFDTSIRDREGQQASALCGSLVGPAMRNETR
jgi:hypothetical protein